MNAVLVVLIALVVAGVVAAVALTYLIVSGMRQIDAATAEVFDMRDAEQSRSNVRRLSKHEVHARLQRKLR